MEAKCTLSNEELIKNILYGDIDKRFIVVCFQNKVQKYAFFDSEDDAFHWWQEHKHPFFETDRPKGWGVSYALTYDKLEKKIIDWNKLFLNDEIVNEYMEQMNIDFQPTNTNTGRHEA